MSNSSDIEPDLMQGGTKARDSTGARIYVGDTDIDAIARVGSTVRLASHRVAKRVARITHRLPSGWPIGLERHLLKHSFPKITISPVSRKSLEQRGVQYTDCAPPPLPRLFNRLPSEYGVARLFQALERGRIEIHDIFAAVRLMGGEGAWRTKSARTRAFDSGHFTEFMKASNAKCAFTRLLDEIVQPHKARDTITRATKIYFATTLYHPLEDGNGRLARALYQCVLRTDLGLLSPIFPLGPIFHTNRHRVLEAKHLWQTSGDASGLMRIIIYAMNYYCDLYEGPDNMLALRAAS